MAIEFKQTLKLGQSLVMTPQLQQAIKLLQLNRLEMQELINQELVENPCLEEVSEIDAYQDDEGSGDSHLENMENREAEGLTSEEMMTPQGDDKVIDGKGEIDWEEYMESFASAGPSLPSTKELPDELPNYENMVAASTDLVSHLEWQISMSDLTDHEKILARLIIGNLSEDGFFIASLEDVAREADIELEDAEEIIKIIQRFDPVGVASRNLRECLLVQASFLYDKDTLVMKIIERHLEDLEKRNIAAICKATGANDEDVKEAARLIKEEFDPKPARSYASGSDNHYIVPDVYVYKVGDDYAIQLNEDGVPRLRVSAYYRKILSQAKMEAKAQAKGDPKLTRNYLQDKLRAAVWLIKSIHNRQKTIYRVMESIVKHQRDFFDKGVHFLKPMVLREVAEDLGVHESTISRVTTNKYVHTPVGTFELKYFFNSGISSGDGTGDVASESVKEKIRSLIAKEDPKRPLSDQKLVELLKEDGIDIARRTVAKYREGLNILSSARRKKLF
ncbi:MAG: RNA polymerase factor sigma-54 [Oligoflexia bacterium]|nr:RNA polymerase factor sigma-54 [Oligoflexia bacterium]